MAKAESGRKKLRTEFPVETARADMKDLLNRAEFHGERIIITRYGKPSAALVSIADLEKLDGAA